MESKINELCPHCMVEVELLNKFEVQTCSSCGKQIIPCSICPTNYENCNSCKLKG